MIGQVPRVPRGVWVGVALTGCSAALYLFFALYWGISTLTEDYVRPGDMPLRGGLGLVLTVIASAGVAASLFAAWSGHRLWHRDKVLSATALVVGTTIGVLPAVWLILVPQFA